MLIAERQDPKELTERKREGGRKRKRGREKEGGMEGKACVKRG